MKNPSVSWKLTASYFYDFSSAWSQRKNQDELNRYLGLRTASAAQGCAVVR
jgi:hypothetical protein